MFEEVKMFRQMALCACTSVTKLDYKKIHNQPSDLTIKKLSILELDNTMFFEFQRFDQKQH